MNTSLRVHGFTLVELMVATALVSILGLVIYSLLNVSLVLGAKNTAMNTAHQQARIGMLEMLGDLHSAISLPYLVDANGNQVNGAGPAAGIAFQKWSSGPHKFKSNANAGAKQVALVLTANAGPTPAAGQRLIVPDFQIEADIVSVSGNAGDFKVNLANISGPALTPPVTYPTATLPIAITLPGGGVGDVVCFVTDRCSYAVSNNSLQWNWNGTRTIVSDITNSYGVLYDPAKPATGTNVPPAPFSLPTTQAGALYYRFVSAVDLSTSDQNYKNRGFKSANVLLNGQVPMKTRLTTYQ